MTTIEHLTVIDVTIASGASLSDAAHLSGAELLRTSGGWLLCGIITPASIDGTSFTFQVSVDGVTFSNMYDDTGVEYSVTMAASRFVVLQPSDFAGALYLKVRTGTSGAPSTQSPAAALQLVLRPA